MIYLSTKPSYFPSNTSMSHVTISHVAMSLRYWSMLTTMHIDGNGRKIWHT